MAKLSETRVCCSTICWSLRTFNHHSRMFVLWGYLNVDQTIILSRSQYSSDRKKRLSSAFVRPNSTGHVLWHRHLCSCSILPFRIGLRSQLVRTQTKKKSTYRMPFFKVQNHYALLCYIGRKHGFRTSACILWWTETSKARRIWPLQALQPQRMKQTGDRTGTKKREKSREQGAETTINYSTVLPSDWVLRLGQRTTIFETRTVHSCDQQLNDLSAGRYPSASSTTMTHHMCRPQNHRIVKGRMISWVTDSLPLMR